MMSAYLSITGKSWELTSPDERLVITLCQRYQLSDILSRILVNRGINLETVESYLAPTIRTMLPDPSCLLDMERAVSRTVEALLGGQKIVVYGDYDVDGACASALLRRYFGEINCPIDLYIPDRIEEGYGANSKALEDLHRQGYKLVLMVDCGTNAFAPLLHAKSLNLDIIVLDHHTAEPQLPKAAAIVNPNRLDQDKKTTELLGHLCAAGVSYLFLIALQRQLRHNSWFQKKKITEPDLLSYLDFVALGTVCDVMPLTGLNRAFVAQGLKVLRQRQNLGLKTLMDVAGVDQLINTYHLGFVLGPRINAGGRVGQANLGSCLLTNTVEGEALGIATSLNQFNQQRQLIEKQVLEQALAQVELNNLHHNPAIVVSGEGWHPGVIGIVASRLKERYNRPACVIGFDEGIGNSFGNNFGKGSGRSISGVCLGTAMHMAVSRGLLEKGGGHAMAAGFTIQRQKFQQFYDFLNSYLEDSLKNHTPYLKLDCYLSLAALRPSLLESLQSFEPYGQGNPTPRFGFANVKIQHLSPVGDTHLRCIVGDQQGDKIKAMAFRVKDTALGNALEAAYFARNLVNIAGTLHLDRWNGREQVSIFIDDMQHIAPLPIN